MPRALSLLIALALLACGREAVANAFGYREHDGFYLRLGLGGAVLTMDRQTRRTGTAPAPAYEGDTSAITGALAFGEVSVGGTPARGLVVAGTWLGHSLPGATLELADGTGLELGGALSFTFVGPTADLFPDPRGGFHFGGGLGFAVAQAASPADPFGRLGGTGGAGTLSTGYGFWVADQWSLGASARFTVARLSGERSAEGVSVTERDTVAVLGLALSALYH